MCFTKPTYEEIKLPFSYIEVPSDLEAGIINIEAYGNVFGENKYCFASYDLKSSQMYKNGDYEQMIELLKTPTDKTVNVIIKLKKGVPKNFKIDVNSLAEVYCDERFKSLSLVCWGFDDKSYNEYLLNSK